MSWKYLQRGFSSTTLESSRLESCLPYETKIAKRFHGKQVISWPLIAWDFKKHPFLRGVKTIFYNKMFSARQIRHLLVASDITISPFLSHNHISISVKNLTFRRAVFFKLIDLRQVFLCMIVIGEVSRSLRYCNAKPTHDRSGASSRRSIPLQKWV